MNYKEIKLFANDIRKTLIREIAGKGGGHIGGSLSICDLIAVLYGDIMKYDAKNPDWEDRDYLVLSKGHSAPAVYAALALKGFFPEEWLDELNRGGTHLPGHSDRTKVPGIDATTGSLGQGFSIACGLAHACKIKGKENRVFGVTGDGENDEGQIWEAAMYGANYHLNNLVMFLDWNKKQIDGTNDEVMCLGDLVQKYQSFGWRSKVINGMSVENIHTAITEALKEDSDKPTMIILDTIKGAGIPSIEAIENNHCIGLPKTLADQCINELEEQRTMLLEEM